MEQGATYNCPEQTGLATYLTLKRAVKKSLNIPNAGITAQQRSLRRQQPFILDNYSLS
jgi:hypothetical protein